MTRAQAAALRDASPGNSTKTLAGRANRLGEPATSVSPTEVVFIRDAGAPWRICRPVRRLLCALVVISFLGGRPARAADQSVCASVKMEIGQELTLERQAFEARMRINNGYEDIVLRDVGVALSITDAKGAAVPFSSDPDDVDALFYVTLDAASNITDLAGSGVVSPATAAEIRWRIIPAPVAGGEDDRGALYYVGAGLGYRIGERATLTEVIPDAITVFPLPRLALDYFLPGPVYGDDPFTDEVEAPLPFSLGLRVLNVGAGAARSLALNSGVPEITDNRNGLLVAFTLTASEVNGGLAAPTLLAEFGDLPAGGAAVARWTMTSSLSGAFTNFQATLSHADELGGEMTSLLREGDTATHRLIHDVLVDAPGRDGVRDFLADDGKVYESDGEDTAVIDATGGAQLTGSDGAYALSLCATPGAFVHVCLPDPEAGGMALKDVVRADGKTIPPANAWLSAKQNAEHQWERFLNLFDVAGESESYTVVYEPLDALNHAPALHALGAMATTVNQPLCFTVAADDADGDLPSLTTGPLPAGVDFRDNGDGTGEFEWTPLASQMGVYRIRFTASDGALSDSATLSLAVNSSEPPPLPAMTVFKFR